MSTLIPNLQLSEIHAMSPEQLRLLRSCEVYDGDKNKDENYVYTHISRNPYDGIVADNIRTKAEYLGVSNNSIYPLEVVPQIQVDKYPNLTKAREARQAKLREKVEV